MTNGCICCTLRDDLLREVARLAQAQRFDYLLIESTGISEPLPVAMTFSFPVEQGSLADIAHLDTMVTVVDAQAWLTDYREGQRLKELNMGVSPEDTRTIADLLIDQVEFANVIILNKTDLVTEAQLGELEGVLHHLNPTARLLRAQEGRVPLTEILHTGLFDLAEAQQSAGWLKELQGEHTPETEEYGIRSFVYIARHPFHPLRLIEFLKSDAMLKVLRSKGIFWLATRHSSGIRWSLAGHVARVSPAGQWLAATPAAQVPDTPQMAEYRARYWDGEFGDRRQEIVFIGQQMDETAMRHALQAALLTEAELALGAAGWQQLPDPFPQWE
jgi:G3E family GTPase